MSATKTERPKMERRGDHGIVAHIGDGGGSMVALCGHVCKSGGVDATHPRWDGKTYCAVCIDLNGGPPNWWRK